MAYSITVSISFIISANMAYKIFCYRGVTGLEFSDACNVLKYWDT